MAEELITDEMPRIKFHLTRQSHFRLPALTPELESLSALMKEMEEKLGACPVLNDGKVGGNCAVRLDYCAGSLNVAVIPQTGRASEGGDSHQGLLISRSGKAPGATLEAGDYVAVDAFDRQAWAATFGSHDDNVRPSSDTPLLWGSLGPGAAERYGWKGPFPNVAVHGHALAVGEGLRYAECKGLPISERSTLFSTPEDLGELEALFFKYPYPAHKCFIRKGHGFFVLGQSMQDVKDTIDEERTKKLTPVLDLTSLSEGEPSGMVLPERPELAFKPHNLQSNQLSTPQSIALYEAAARGDPNEVKAQLAAGGSPNWYNNPAGGGTALHAVAKSESKNTGTVISLLLGAGASPEVVTLPESNTPLHLAAFHGSLEGVKLMVEGPVGASLINRPNAYGNTPLHEAAVGAHGSIVSYLLEKGADVNAVNKRGSTSLLFAIYADQATPQLVSLFVDAGADPARTDEDGVGALHVAAIKGHEAVVTYLLEKGVKPLPDSTGSTPAYYAKAKGFNYLLKLLGEQEAEQQAQA